MTPAVKEDAIAMVPEYGAMGLGYRSQVAARRDGRIIIGAAGYAHEKVSREDLQKQSREFFRNNDLYRGMLSRLRSYVIGRGFKLQVTSESDPEWVRIVEARWAPFWKRPEVSGRLSGRRCERKAFEEVVITGEVAIPKVLLNGQRRIQLVEAEQIRGPESSNREGIEFDDYGKPLKFWIAPYGRSGQPAAGEAKAHDAATILYISEPERPSSHRAVPPGQASFGMLHRIVDTCNSEAIAWQLQARLALIVSREEGPPVAGGIVQPDPEKSADGDERFTAEMRYATVFFGKPGEKVEGVQRTAPSQSFAETLRMFLRLLGLGLGLPLEFILLDWTQSNYSQSRAVVEQFVVATVEEWQLLMEEEFHEPIFAWWLQGEIADQKIPPAPADFVATWIKPRLPWLDKLKESQASGEQVDRGQQTHAAVLMSQNLDPDVVVPEIEDEVRRAIGITDSIFKDTGVRVPWEIFCGRKPPTATPAIAPAAADPNANAGDTTTGDTKPGDTQPGQTGPNGAADE